MKKIALVCTLVCLFMAAANPLHAQVKIKKNTTEVKKTRKVTAETKKDGTPDMRYKKNKEAKEKTMVVKPAKPVKTETKTVTVAPKMEKPKRLPTATTVTKTTSKTKTSSTDKAIGKDAKGRTIYEGPRGGHYVITSNGNKEYISKDH